MTARAQLGAAAATLAAVVIAATPGLAQTQAAPAQPPVAVPAETTARATAADSVLEARTRELASQLRCVVCQGLSIQDSPSELAQQMKAVVREQLAAGRTPDEVRRYFTDKYGEWILLEPKASGFNLLVYLLPALAVVGGIAFVAIAVKRWTAPTADATAGEPTPAPSSRTPGA